MSSSKKLLLWSLEGGEKQGLGGVPTICHMSISATDEY